MFLLPQCKANRYFTKKESACAGVSDYSHTELTIIIGSIVGTATIEFQLQFNRNNSFITFVET